MDEAIYPIVGQESNLPLCIFGVGWCDWQYHVNRTDGYAFPQINFCIDGKGKLIVNEKEYLIEAGMSFFLPANVKHEYYSLESVFKIHWITFGGRFINEILNQLDLQVPCVLVHENYSKLELLWLKILQSTKHDKLYGNYNASGFLYEYLIEYYHTVNGNFTVEQQKKSNIILTIVNYIEEHYANDLSLAELAGLGGVSEQYLCKIFKEQFQMRPFEYITKRRIQESKQLIVQGRYSIDEISSLVGFHDCSYYCKLFKKYEKMTPKTFYNIPYHFTKTETT